MLCGKTISGGSLCQRPKSHTRACSHIPLWDDFLVGGLSSVPEVGDKVTRSPSETAGKGGEWGFLQNKVSRSSQVAIPLAVYINHSSVRTHHYDNGMLVYATPSEWHSGLTNNQNPQLTIGENCIILYISNSDWLTFPPATGWSSFKLIGQDEQPVTTWRSAVGWRGHYYARFKKDGEWYYGPNGRENAIGIRQDEYCSKLDQSYIVAQMAFLVWSMPGTLTQFSQASTPQYLIDFLTANNMLDLQRMESVGMINSNGQAQCPFCQEVITYQELINQAPQQTGRQLASSNATALHLMHIEPLEMGSFNHKPYNLAFGHAKCNHAQGEDSIPRSIEFLIGRRLVKVLANEGFSATDQQRIMDAIKQ